MNSTVIGKQKQTSLRLSKLSTTTTTTAGIYGDVRRTRHDWVCVSYCVALLCVNEIKDLPPPVSQINDVTQPIFMTTNNNKTPGFRSSLKIRNLHQNPRFCGSLKDFVADASPMRPTYFKVTSGDCRVGDPYDLPFKSVFSFFLTL